MHHMANESAPTIRKLSAEFWAVIGSAVAIGALVLSTTGSLGDQIDGVDNKIERGNAELRSEIRKLQAGQSAIRERLARLETLAGIDVAAVETESESAP